MASGTNFDSSINASEEKRFLNKYINLIRKICKELNSPLNKGLGLAVIYYKFQILNKNPKNGMLRTQLKEFVHNTLNISNEMINEYVVCAMQYGYKNQSQVSIECWIRSMLIFLNGNMAQKINHCFKVYDRLQQGIISSKTMTLLLQDSLYVRDPIESEDLIKDLIDIIMMDMDKDRDGVVSRSDYTNYCLKKPLSMEAFGQCWPSPEVLRSILASFSPRIYYVK